MGEAYSFIRRSSKNFSKRWFRPCSKTFSFARSHFAVSLTRKKNRCLRVSRFMNYIISRLVYWEYVAVLGFFSTLEQLGTPITALGAIENHICSYFAHVSIFLLPQFFLTFSTMTMILFYFIFIINIDLLSFFHAGPTRNFVFT